VVEFHFKKPDESSGYLLWQVTMLWQRKIKKELDAIGITHTQFVLMASLAWLLKSSDSVTQTDIANHSNTDTMMVSKVLRSLQSKGFLLRQEHATDTRAKVVCLTEQGQTILQKALKIVEAVDISFFSVLENEKTAFNANMLRLIN
jgi:DNA-binding MarR family transcriptional regulator